MSNTLKSLDWLKNIVDVKIHCSTCWEVCFVREMNSKNLMMNSGNLIILKLRHNHVLFIFEDAKELNSSNDCCLKHFLNWQKLSKAPYKRL